MNRSPAFKSLRALVALVVTLMQLVGALHFSLVRHSYSAELGGVVHVHASLARPTAKPPRSVPGPRAPSATSSTPSCNADVCAAANAPQSTAPHFEPLDAGAVAFGDPALLSERLAPFAVLRRVLLGAPKTSPPV
ncbi:MAG: hypothetical protein ABIQ16_21830 [Polyangiaceae bacterium]